MNIKKLFILLLSALIIIASIPIISTADYEPKQALPISSGIEALRNQFESGVAPETEGYSLDYKYYSPVGTNDTNKYPIVIFLHGIGHGEYEGSQLEDSDMPYWSSSEFQARFDNAGGAFIILPRSPENKNIYWNENFIEPLHALIDDFIAQHKDNVDTTRISITGSSAGGAMVWFMLESYPEYFASAFPIASTETPTDNVIKASANTAMWIIASSKDPFVNYQTKTLKIWNKICKYNNNPSNCRLSTFGTVYNPDGSKSSDNHHLAGVITYDLHMLDESNYTDLKTIDGNENTVDISSPNGLIKWISNTYSSFNPDEYTNDDTVDISYFQQFFIAIRNGVFHVVHIVQVILGL